MRVRPTRDFGFVGVAGRPAVRVEPGVEWEADDPFVVAHPEMFEPATQTTTSARRTPARRKAAK